MKNYIKPECMPYYYDETGNKKESLILSKSIAYTADGYLLPCCWCDSEMAKKDMVKFGFFQEHLKLANNSEVEDILYSDNWKIFVHVIMTDFDKSPRCCREKCGVVHE